MFQTQTWELALDLTLGTESGGGSNFCSADDFLHEVSPVEPSSPPSLLLTLHPQCAFLPGKLGQSGSL